MKENVGTQKLKKSEHLLLSALTLSPKKKNVLHWAEILRNNLLHNTITTKNIVDRETDQLFEVLSKWVSVAFCNSHLP